MPKRTFKVYFSRPAVGEKGDALGVYLRALHYTHGQHLPPLNVDNERFQFRSLELVGTVWKGVFAKLRDDAPNVVDHLNQEQELALAAGASIIEKCHFLYRESGNVLVWQVQKAAGSATKASAYLSNLLSTVVTFAQVMNNAELEEMLNNNLYEIDFAYARPASLVQGVSPWSQRAFDIMGAVHAAAAKFTFRAKRGQSLADAAKAAVREMIGGPGFKRIKVRLTEDSDPVKLFLAPLTEEFTIEVLGRNPAANLIYQELEDAYSRQQQHIPPSP